MVVGHESRLDQQLQVDTEEERTQRTKEVQMMEELVGGFRQQDRIEMKEEKGQHIKELNPMGLNVSRGYKENTSQEEGLVLVNVAT